MPTRLVFRCDYCDAQPDRDTQRTLEAQLPDRRFGRYLDAQPGNWLIFNGVGRWAPGATPAAPIARS